MAKSPTKKSTKKTSDTSADPQPVDSSDDSVAEVPVEVPAVLADVSMPAWLAKDLSEANTKLSRLLLTHGDAITEFDACKKNLDDCPEKTAFENAKTEKNVIGKSVRLAENRVVSLVAKLEELHNGGLPAVDTPLFDTPDDGLVECKDCTRTLGDCGDRQEGRHECNEIQTGEVTEAVDGAE